MPMPTDPEAKKKIKSAMQEISDSLTRIAAEKDLIKDIVGDICEEYQLNKKIFRKLAVTFHKQNFSKEVADNEEFEAMYEQITGETTLGVNNV